jgi:hypothetical protein
VVTQVLARTRTRRRQTDPRPLEQPGGQPDVPLAQGGTAANEEKGRRAGRSNQQRQPNASQHQQAHLIDLPLWFREHGYYVAGGGKIYHHMPGFIDMRGWHEYFIRNKDLKQKGWGLDSWGEGAPLPAELPSSPIAKHLLEREMERFPDKKHNKVNSHMEWGTLPDEAEEKMADSQFLPGNQS